MANETETKRTGKEKTKCTEEANTDWCSEGYPELQGELEIVDEPDIVIPTRRYDELIRAEHTVELIKDTYMRKSIKFDSDRAEFIKILLGLETADE